MSSWWGGGSFGPRLLCEVMLCAVILLIPVVQELSLTDSRLLQVITAGFVVAATLGIAVHFRGATARPAALVWLLQPVNVDTAPQRLWDWHDPQFLRGMGR